MPASPDADVPEPRTLHRIGVVGAGLAGLRTTASLREAGFRGEITVFGAEGLAPYDRPPLSKALFSRTEPAWLATELGSDIHALANRVELASPVRALSPLDGADGGVLLELSDDESFPVDVVVLACGAHAYLPVDWEGAAVLHTAADAAALREQLTPGTSLACIGAGWIGSEIAGVAARHGCRVTVLEDAAAPLARHVGDEVGALLAPWFAASEVELHVGARVTSVHPDAVHLADGRRVAADVVLAAVGARPATSWLESTVHLTARGAIAVDRLGRADGSAGGFAPGSVWAVGDCADRDSPRDGLVPGGHWAAALHDPTLVALGILGGPLPDSDPAPHTFSTQHGHEIALVGQPRPGAAGHVRGTPSTGPWTALYLQQDAGLPAGTAVLTAGFAVDAPRDISALRSLLGRPELPVVDVAAATDPATSLREAVRP